MKLAIFHIVFNENTSLLHTPQVCFVVLQHKTASLPLGFIFLGDQVFHRFMGGGLFRFFLAAAIAASH